MTGLGDMNISLVIAAIGSAFGTGVAGMAAIGAWSLYGRKLDPHQAFEDRARLIAVQLNSCLYVPVYIPLRARSVK